ncbi:hypothetical protein EB232_35725 (plasmid) [Mesorhizobium sp. NZP2077]|nr:hypothetical protein EB232_35725 [Mesorhizobium sp. NZP2077]QKD20684.1 hypothetical protein HGP13_37660 [Mesorhizobium sp. NZP2077]
MVGDLGLREMIGRGRLGARGIF